MATGTSNSIERSSVFTARRTIALVFGLLIGLSGINHGLFEALQGWKPTEGLVVQAIGEAQRMWPRGTEEAFTIVPNFLITGVLAMLTGLTVIVWCVGFLQIRYGAFVLLTLFILLFLVGGGIAQVLFFLPVWAYSTRVNKPLLWWKRVLSGRASRFLSSTWKYTLAISSLLFLASLEIAVVGFFPGMTNPDTLLYTCWSFLAVSWILMNTTFIAGFADDIVNQRS